MFWPGSKRPPPSQDEPSQCAEALVAWLLASVLLSIGLYVAVQRRGLDSLLRMAQLDLTDDERWLLPAAVIATSCLLLLPGAFVAAFVARWSSRRAARTTYCAVASGIVFWLSLDQDVLSSVGRHVTEIAQIALLPRGHEAAGELSSWTVTIALWLSVSVVWSALVAIGAERVTRLLLRGASPSLRRFLGLSFSVLVIGMSLAPHALHDSWRHQNVQERLYGALVLDLRLNGGEATHQRFDDPVLNALAPALQDSYESAFPLIMAPKPADTASLALHDRPPNVVLIVAESLRHDVFGAELMPRLWRWAQGGVMAAQHDAGTMYSEAGMFALLYGRSPAVYHPTLDAQVPPQLCVTLRASGYQCGYYSGHPEVWKRREEFINARTFDHFVHDDRGSWPEWDERALSQMVQRLRTADRPQLALVFLMSSHFEYRYPAQYEVDLPVAQSTWHVTHTQSLGDDDEIAHRNRYRNCMRFIDDLVADAITELDPSRNIIVFTGDHGESINDDGRFTHGYSFADITTRTPLAMVGPGLPPTTLTRATEHRDLLVTLTRLLAGDSVEVEHTHGLDMLGPHQRNATLATYASINRDVIQAQLRHGNVRLRLDLNARRPAITVLGFEDELGHLLPRPSTTLSDVPDLAAAFERELSILRH